MRPRYGNSYLKGSDIDEKFENGLKLFPADLDGVASPFQTDLAHGVVSVLEFADFQVGDEHTRNIFLRFIQPNS